MTTRQLFIATFVFGGLLCHNLVAGPIIGTFDIVGTVTVTTTTMHWTLVEPGPVTVDNKALIQGVSGIFDGLVPPLPGTTITIQDLNRATEPVDPNPTPPNTTFGPFPFISFDAGPALQVLNINQIFEGVESVAQCFASPPAPGQHCTPSGPAFGGPSPFSFTNKPGGGSTATWDFAGVSAGSPKMTWIGEFTSQFNVPFQTVLAAFGPGGSGFVTNSYSATITVAIPEPATMCLVGLALIAIPLGMKHLKKS